MEQGKQGATMMLKGSPQQLQNPIEQIQTRYKHLENGFNLWLSKQSVAVEAAAVTATTAAKWFAVGAFATPLVFIIPPDGQQDFILRPLIPARNLAVVAGVNAGIRCVFKRWRGKEDVRSSMAAGFGSGALFSLLFGMGGPVSIGIQFAIAQAGNFTMDESLSRHADETRNMKKDFKRGLLLPLLNDSVLRDVKISLLLILDHIQREQDLREKRGSRR